MQPMQSLRKHVNHVQSGTFTEKLNKTFCCQVQAVPKEQSSVFRYSMHEDSGVKNKMDVVVCGSGSTRVFCEPRALQQFYNK